MRRARGGEGRRSGPTVYRSDLRQALQAVLSPPSLAAYTQLPLLNPSPSHEAFSTHRQLAFPCPLVYHSNNG